jgi:hypothetical protein
MPAEKNIRLPRMYTERGQLFAHRKEGNPAIPTIIGGDRHQILDDQQYACTTSYHYHTDSRLPIAMTMEDPSGPN